MKVTPEIEAQVQILSELELYDRAVQFTHEWQQSLAGDKQSGSQLNGLLMYARSWDDLIQFVRHQKGRSWPPKKAYYGTFYAQLEQQLQSLAALGQEQFIPNSDDLIKAELREKTGFFAGLLAREFIQHLVAEMMWQKEVAAR